MFLVCKLLSHPLSLGLSTYLSVAHIQFTERGQGRRSSFPHEAYIFDERRVKMLFPFLLQRGVLAQLAWLDQGSQGEQPMSALAGISLPVCRDSSRPFSSRQGAALGLSEHAP